MKKIIHSTLLLFTFALLSCGDPVYSIQDLYNIPGCTGPCGIRMDCEGMEVTVEAKLNPRNMLTLGRKYFLRSEEADRTISIEFAESIPDDVVHQLDEAQKNGKTVRLKGVIEGFDLSTEEYCQRAQILFIQDAKDITVK